MNNEVLKKAVLDYLEKVGGKDAVAKLFREQPEQLGPFMDRMSQEINHEALSAMQESAEVIMELDGLLRDRKVLSSRFIHQVLTERDHLQKNMDTLLAQNNTQFGEMIKLAKEHLRGEKKQ